MPPASRSAAPDFRQRLAIETPEHVALDLEIAGVGSRVLAALVDLLLVGAALLGLALLVGLAGRWIGGAGGPIYVIVAFLIVYGYFTLFEALAQGRTPGKRRIGIRVVRDTGHAVTFGAAAVRNLLRAADFLPIAYLGGLVLVALHPRGKRLGDMVAGTIVVRDRPAESAPRAAGAERAADAAAEDRSSRFHAPELADEEFRLLDQYVARADALPPAARERLAAGLAARFAERYPVRPDSPAEFLATLHARELERRQGVLGAHAAGGALGDRLVARKRERWLEFERLAERAAGRGLDAFAAHELPDFAARYREVAADLARARTYRADASVTAWLERLVASGHNALYRDERHTGRRIWAVLVRECPAAVVGAWRTVLVATAMFCVPAAAGYALLREQPALAEELIPETMLRRAEAGVERTASGRRYYTAEAGERPLVASFIITNNVRVAFTCFAGGVLLGVGALVLLAFNGFAIGSSAGHFANAGLLGYLLEFIVGHGVLELFAIWVAGAAGFLLGRAIVAPGDLTRADALVVNGHRAIRMVGAATVLLVVAGLIEGFVSASTMDWRARLAVSAASAVFLVLYLVNGARWRGEVGG
jgi:uncharacterized membrane protein SpoIIM required for sporulation/uncharacterized RDD family membrane protein YckC